jgi:UDPglucose--hexose-1-phosphate uridylyltransferase
MSEMRWNPVLGEWVVTATHRQDRTFLPPAGYCPLCPTQEGGFPTEVPQPAYDFVVFENKFPSLKRDPHEPAVEATDLYPVLPSQGTCEVVLYSSNHTGTLTDMPVEKLAQLVEVWRDRYNDLGSREDIDYVFIFENKGEAIGVTIHHPHGQIYAFSFIPPKVERKIKNEEEHYKKTGRCLHCDVVKHELNDARRIVADNDSFVAFVPFYARYPYEVHIYSRKHLASMADFGALEVDELAQLLHVVLKKYDNLWGFSMPYMMVIHQKPTDGKTYPGQHFHIEFYPPLRTPQKMKYLAGCESGAGTFVNDTLPEDKATELRRAEPVTEKA